MSNEDLRPEDKRIWSATKRWFNSLDSSVQWGDLAEHERGAAREAFLDAREQGEA